MRDPIEIEHKVSEWKIGESIVVREPSAEKISNIAHDIAKRHFADAHPSIVVVNVRLAISLLCRVEPPPPEEGTP